MDLEFTCSNDSWDTVTPERWLIIPQFRAATLTMAAFLILFMVVGIPWNLLLIVVIIKKRLFKQPAILLLLNQAVTNLLLCLIAMPLSIIPAIAGEFIFGNSDYARCRVCHLTLIMSMLLFISLHNIALLSLDRFLYVKKPLKYNTIVTERRVSAILVFSWVVFTVFCILPVFGVGLVRFSEVISICILTATEGLTVHHIYFSVFIVSAAFTPMIILFITNTWMTCIMAKSIFRGYARAKRNSTGPWGFSLSPQVKEKFIKYEVHLLQIFLTLYSRLQL